MIFHPFEKSAKLIGKNKFVPIIVLLILSSGCSPASMEAMGGSGQGAGGSQGFIFGTLYFILMAFFAYFFLVIKPQQVEEDDRKKYVSELKKGSEVTTTGGLMGKIVQIKEDVITIEVAPKVNVQIKSSYIEPTTVSKK